MKKVFEKTFRTALLTLPVSVGAGAYASVNVSADQFVSDYGVFNYQKRPGHLPWNDQKENPYNGEKYYAVGYGIELTFTNNQYGEYTCEIYDYQYRDDIAEFAAPLVWSTLQTKNGNCTISRISDTELQVDFVDTMRIYKNAGSLVFTEIGTLLDEAVEDQWGGGYFKTSEDGSSTQFTSVVQMYGTSDYLLVFQTEEQSVPQDVYTTLFTTESEGDLIHEYTGYNPMVLHYSKDENENLICRGATDEIYQKCSDSVMWQ